MAAEAHGDCSLWHRWLGHCGKTVATATMPLVAGVPEFGGYDWPQGRGPHARDLKVTPRLPTQTAQANHVEAPATYQDINEHLSAQEWRVAVEEELASHEEHGTWTLERAPPGVSPTSCKWVFAIKGNKLGDSIWYSTRLVARGFAQLEGRDFTEIIRLRSME